MKRDRVLGSESRDDLSSRLEHSRHRAWALPVGRERDKFVYVCAEIPLSHATTPILAPFTVAEQFATSENRPLLAANAVLLVGLGLPVSVGRERSGLLWTHGPIGARNG